MFFRRHKMAGRVDGRRPHSAECGVEHHRTGLSPKCDCQRGAALRNLYAGDVGIQTNRHLSPCDDSVHVFRGIPDCAAVSLRRLGNRCRHVSQCRDHQCFGSHRIAGQPYGRDGSCDNTVCAAHSVGDMRHNQKIRNQPLIP